MCSITQYLSKTNVQLGASYHTGSQSNTKYEEGYQAAAKYMNAGRDEIGNGVAQLVIHPFADDLQLSVLQQPNFS
jgi:hypothetical protein